MKQNTISLKQAYKMEPKEIVDYFQSKGLKTSYNWREIYEEAHAKAFTVAKMTEIDLLKDTQTMLNKALKEGWSESHFTREAKDLFSKKGWTGFKEAENPKTGKLERVELGTPRRIKTIFQSNINSAYAAGRYKQQLEDVDIAPYFQYMCILDETTRPEHRAMHGKVFRYDDPFWAAFYPPNGWGCRCFVRSLTPNEIKKRGLTVEQSGDDLKQIDIGEKNLVGSYRFKQAGKEYNLIADAGWSTNMGAHAWNLDVLAYNKIEKLPQEIKDKFISDMASNPHNKKVIDKLINATIKNNLHGKGIEVPLTWFTPEIIKSLENQKIRLQTPVVVFQDRQVGHSLGAGKTDKQRLTEEQFKNITNIISNPDSIYLDTEIISVVYVKKLPEDEIINNCDCIKVPVRINYTGKRRPVNYIGTTARVNYKNEFTGSRYKKIE